jgi:catechol 2,3-dioxygenase-like lactoylglutathione lyase family enzyme|tara:strand:- start:6224 stop:6649 length:426 start_codon:yes stop_codon:yes gene_type:complete
MNIKGLHHFAWKCADAQETIDFYSGILKLPLVHTIEKDYVPSTGQYAPYKHIFFGMTDGSNIAFFDTGDGKGTTTDCDDWIVHFAFEVERKHFVDKWYKQLKLHNIDVIGPTNHDDWIYSIYFFDPNGLRLEITTELKKDR